jgi:hypothetical protein
VTWFCVPSFCNCIGGVMASVLASSVVDRDFKLQSDQAKDYSNGTC